MKYENSLNWVSFITCRSGFLGSRKLYVYGWYKNRYGRINFNNHPLLKMTSHARLNPYNNQLFYITRFIDSKHEGWFPFSINEEQFNERTLINLLYDKDSHLNKENVKRTILENFLDTTNFFLINTGKKDWTNAVIELCKDMEDKTNLCRVIHHVDFSRMSPKSIIIVPGTTSTTGTVFPYSLTGNWNLSSRHT